MALPIEQQDLPGGTDRLSSSFLTGALHLNHIELHLHFEAHNIVGTLSA